MKGCEEKVSEVRVRLKEQIITRDAELEKCALELHTLRSELDCVKRARSEAEEESSSLKTIVDDLRTSLSEKFSILTERAVSSEVSANSAKVELGEKKSQLESGLRQMEKLRV
jgi:hypothetical protein